MVCPFCGSTDTSVTNSRNKQKTPRVWRRRSCAACSRIFSTNELPNYEQLILIKRSGRKEKFSYPKLFISVWRACEPLKSSQATAEALSNTIIGNLLKQSLENELTTELVSDEVSKVLQRYNTGAYVRYVSLQTNVSNAGDLKRIIKFHQN